MPATSNKKCRAEIEREVAHQKHLLERSEGIKMAAILYSVLAFTGLVAIILGIATTVWYDAAVTNDSLTTAGNTITFTEKWGMGTKGIGVKTEYCEDGSGCFTDQDVFLAFDQLDNESFEWPAAYVTPAASAASAANTLVILVSLAIVTSVGSLVVMNVGLCFRIPSWAAWGCVAANFFSFVMATVGTFLFVKDTAAIRTLFKTDSVIENTSPNLQMGWSAYISLGGNCATLASTVPLVFAVIWVTGSSLASLNEAVLKERAARVKMYLDDLNQTSHGRESHPVDNAPVGAKRAGWTREIVTAPVNNLLEIGSYDGKILNPTMELIVNSPPVCESNPNSPGGDDSNLIPSSGASSGLSAARSQAKDVNKMGASSFGKEIPGFANPAFLKAKKPPMGSPLAEMREEFVTASNAKLVQTKVGGKLLLPAKQEVELKKDPELENLEQIIAEAAPKMQSKSNTLPIGAVNAVERNRNVTRAPQPERPYIAGFVNSTGKAKKVKASNYETAKVMVTRN